MRHLLSFFLAILISTTLLSVSSAKQNPASKQTASPCATECNKEHKRCIDESRKLKKTERKKQITECNKSLKECKAKCNNPEESENK